MTARLPGLCFCCLFVAYGYLAQDIRLDFWAEEEVFNARTFPTLVAAGGVLVSLLLACAPPVATSAAPGLSALTREGARFAMLVCAMFAYGLLLEPLGFIPATVLFLVVGFVTLGERQPLPVIATACAVAAFFFGLMQALDVHLAPFPPGIFPDD